MKYSKKTNRYLRFFRLYGLSRGRFLEHIGMKDSCRDPIADFSEVLASHILQGQLATSRVQPLYDLIRRDGSKVQVRCLINPAHSWRNDHLIEFKDKVDQYALLIFRGLLPQLLIVFKKHSLAEVCNVLKKRHAKRESTLQLTQANIKVICDNKEKLAPLDVEVYKF